MAAAPLAQRAGSRTSRAPEAPPRPALRRSVTSDGASRRPIIHSPEVIYDAPRPGRARERAAWDRPPAYGTDPRAGPSSDPPRRLPAREWPRAAVGDPRGHVQRPRRRRAAIAARGPARRDRRTRRDRGDVSLGVRAVVARARERVRAHRALHDLRPSRHAAGDRLAAVRRRARADPAGARRLRAAGERGSAG